MAPRLPKPLPGRYRSIPLACSQAWKNGSAEPFGDGNAAVLILVNEAEPPSVRQA